jgi:hypothetical protein
MISYRDAEGSRPISVRPLLKTVLTVAVFALVAYAATVAIESAGDLFGPTSASVAGFEPSRIGLGGTERVAGDAGNQTIDYLPARLTVNAAAEDGPQPDTF